MKKFIVLSVNDNPDYLYFTPLTCWAWRKFGWEPIVMNSLDQIRNGMFPLIRNSIKDVKFLPFENRVEGYRSDTITQVSRLYAACVQDGYLMTGDIDMIPLSDYWKFNPDEITIWGHDLTGYTHYPICYIGMHATRWREVMGLTFNDYNELIKRDLDAMPQAKESASWEKRWFVDQDLITKRIDATEFKKTIINRGQYPNGYAKGRVDRGSWSLNHEQFIDCHMFQQLYHRGNEKKFDMTMDLLQAIWPNEDFSWFIEYTKAFKKLTGHD